MKNLIYLIPLFIFAACDDKQETEPNYHLYWETRHDSIPDVMQGEWVSVTDKNEIALNITSDYVMTKDFSVNPAQGNAVNSGVWYSVYQNDHTYTLAFSSEGQLAITVDNDCYGTFTRFKTDITEPEQPVNNPNVN